MKDDVLGQVVSTLVICLVTALLKKFDNDKGNEIVDLSKMELTIRRNNGDVISVER